MGCKAGASGCHSIWGSGGRFRGCAVAARGDGGDRSAQPPQSHRLRANHPAASGIASQDAIAAGRREPGRQSAVNDASLIGAYYARPAILALAGDVAGRRILDAGCALIDKGLSYVSPDRYEVLS